MKERKRKGLVLDMFPTLKLDNCFLLDNCESEIERQMERTRGQGERERLREKALSVSLPTGTEIIQESLMKLDKSQEVCWRNWSNKFGIY